MVKRICKWLGKAVLVVMALVLICYGYIYINIQKRLDKTYKVAVTGFLVKTDSAILAKGKHLSTIKGCNDCHGQNLAGRVINDDALMGRLVAPNLTGGKGGIGAGYTTTDWITALRHGLNKDHKPLIVMPSHETAQLSQDDMAAIIAYCRQVQAVDNELPANNIAFLARIFGYLNKFVLIPAEKIDHKTPLQNIVDESSPMAYGKYLSVSCQGCHRSNLKGGDPLAPGLPAVPDITGTGHMGNWTDEQFTQVLRTGKRPDGSQIDNNNMPWKMTAEYSPKEIAALYEFLKANK